MLVEDAGSPLHGAHSSERKTEILTAFGDIQHATVKHVDQLLELGCADRRPPTLIPLIEPLLDDDLAISTLTPDEITELQWSVPAMIEMCERLSDYAIPSTLIHGDLHAGNVLNANGNMVFFDWTEACIAHPFMDVFMIFNEKDDVIRNRMRDAYLALWTEFESAERLQELWSLCGVVHALHHAVSYQSILRHTEVRSRRELAGTVPFLLREALRYLRSPA